MSRRVRRTRGRRRYAHGGSHNGMRMNNSCPPGMHMMPDGTCMEGAYHGASSSGGGYRRGGNTRRYAHGGRNNGCGPGEMCHGGSPHNGMRRGGSTRRRMRHGGHHHQVNATHLANSAQMATYHHHNAVGGPPVYPMGIIAGESMYGAMNSPSYQNSVPESSHNHGRHGRTGISTTQMRRGGRPTRRMEHGGHHESERASDYATKHRGRDAHGRTIQR